MTPSTFAITAPEASEYAPYYGKYVESVGGGDIVSALERQGAETVALLSGLTAQQADYRYAPKKWSVKEVLGHIIDSERIFAYRALRIARRDPKPMEGFEQDDYVLAGSFGNRTISSLVQEFAAVRQASLLLFRSLDADAWMQRGTANQAEVSVRALAYVIAGHELHHRRVLQEKYLAGFVGRGGQTSA